MAAGVGVGALAVGVAAGAVYASSTVAAGGAAATTAYVFTTVHPREKRHV